jgi:hypothetical protein
VEEWGEKQSHITPKFDLKRNGNFVEGTCRLQGRIAAVVTILFSKENEIGGSRKEEEKCRGEKNERGRHEIKM